jgi:hypothetical protein
VSLKPLVPDSQPIRQVLARTEPLQRLQQRLRDSKARLDAVRGCLPAGLLHFIKAGPLDDDQWTLLVSNQAVAAKLRHFQPLLEKSLRDAGWPSLTLRIKVSFS